MAISNKIHANEHILNEIVKAVFGLTNLIMKPIVIAAEASDREETIVFSNMLPGRYLT